MPSGQRESLGRCFSHMVVVENGIDELHSGFDLVTFSKQSGAAPMSLLDGAITKGERVVLSTEDGRYGIMTGFVVALSESRVSVDVRGRLVLPPLPRNGVYDCVVDIEDIAPPVRTLSQRRRAAQAVVWRIDKDQLSLITGSYESLARAMEAKHGQLRELVMGHCAPTFDTSVAPALRPGYLSPCVVLSVLDLTAPFALYSLHTTLNAGQQHAIQLALQARNYLLILGTPGSGKTTVLAQLVQLLHQRNQSVLIAGHTHASVDNVLRKLLELKVAAATHRSYLF
jgi:hypothetical protein